jgi:FAD/FMN-containing dehydrogenase
VTSLEYALHPEGTVYAGALLLPPSWKVLRGLASLAAAAPDELTLIANLMPAPPAPFVPPEAVGRPVLAILGVFAGDPDAGERALAPFRALATPIADLFGPMPYPAIYGFTESAALPHASVTRTLFLDAIDDTVIETILESAGRATSPRTMIQVRILGGAMARVPVDATAFAHRHAPVFVAVMATHSDPASAPADIAWADSFIEALRPRAVGAYVNFLEDEGEERIHEAYPARTYRRLAAVKATYDPDNVFRRNQNIPPGR